MERSSIKWCPGCREWRGRHEFSKRRASADGLQYRCKYCQRSEMRAVRERRKKAHEVAVQMLIERHRDEFQKLMTEVVA